MYQQEAVIAGVPRSVEPLMSEPELALAWEHQVAARKAEAGKITALLDYQKRLIDYYSPEHGVPRAYVSHQANGEAAALLGVSDITATITLEAAGFARNYLPATWEAFHTGQIDLTRVRKIVAACCELEDDTASIVDTAAAREAAARSTSDFTHWLARYMASTDFQAYMRMRTSRRKERHVSFEHLPHGMSFISAFLPTIEAVAIEKRVKITARRQHSAAKESQAERPGAEHEHAEHDSASKSGQQNQVPTLGQREADVFSAWLRTNPTDELAPIEAKIMVMIPETTLTGQSDEPGLAADRSWALDAEEARALAADPAAQHQWFQGRTRTRGPDADVDVLSVTYSGRFPPQRLREALIFRDGRCRAPGCTIAAERCDLDHQTPFGAGGETTAANLRALCRRHHRLKSHGYLHPPARSDTNQPSGPSPPADLWWPIHSITLAS